MEQNFQTSFIPKKPMIEERAVASRPVGFFTVVSMFLFFTVLLASGGLYFYKGILAKNLESMQANLDLAKNRFEPSKITELQVLDKRLSASTQILNRHIAISPIFKMLSAVTMKTVRYTKFSYILGADANSKMQVKLSGVAIGYRSIALQSDLLTTNKQIIDPVFSNLSLDDKGNVLFELTFAVDPSFINYEQLLKTQTQASTAIQNQQATGDASSGSFNNGNSSFTGMESPGMP